MVSLIAIASACLALLAAPRTGQCACGAALSIPAPAVNDNCGVASVINDFNGTSDASDTYPVGTTTVIWTVTDIHGNVTTCSFEVTITDDEIPSIVCTGDINQTADAGA